LVLESIDEAPDRQRLVARGGAAVQGHGGEHFGR
jgi:hypothetical protein